MSRSRQKILDATVDLIDSDGYGSLTIAAIAAQAGVTRPTVYAHFGTLAAVTSQAVGDLAFSIVAELQVEAEKSTRANDYIVEMIALARAAILGNRVLREVLLAQNDVLMFDDEVIVKGVMIGGPLLDPAIERDPRLAAARDDLNEVVVRTCLSVFLFSSPATSTDESLRALLHAWIDPVLEGLAQR